ncbi:GGDEF domain-containing protein [Alkalimonas sp. NCh-2]|uniref:GGDEF domain-containing protein n=1 Tax=Alkalimonas sp. NCh-2 TaxID=3144846 RepID=UPI0031F7043A
MWRLHQIKLALTSLSLVIGAWLAVWLGQPKPAAIIDWFDVLGEGTTLLVCLGWLLLIVSRRPKSQVTNWLFLGCSLLTFSYLLDVLDEFFRYPEHLRLMSWLESIPAPFGMLALTLGVLGWLKEQRVIERQLQSREQVLREHQWIDPLTQLYSAAYLQALLQREQAAQQQLNLLVLDLKGFSHYNRQHGVAAGDTLLRHLSELSLSLLRPADVLCRFAGDRFVALLPATGTTAAELLALHLKHQLDKHLTTGAAVQLQYAVLPVSPSERIDAIFTRIEQVRFQPSQPSPVTQPA